MTDKEQVDKSIEKTPHIIREFDVIKVKNLRIGQIFYHDFDAFVFFFSTCKRYVESFEKDGAIVQCLHKNEDGSMGYNIRTKYELEDDAYIFIGEKVAIY